MIEQKRKKSVIFCAQMVDFHMLGHILYKLARVVLTEWWMQHIIITNEGL